MGTQASLPADVATPDPFVTRIDDRKGSFLTHRQAGMPALPLGSRCFRFSAMLLESINEVTSHL
jgi:hypothetical protein